MKKQIQSRKKKSLLPIKSIISMDEIGTDGTVRYQCLGKEHLMRIMKVSGIDIFNFFSDDQQTVFSNFANATKSIKLPCKYIFTSAHPNLKEQSEFLDYKIGKTKNKFYKALLSEEKSLTDKLKTCHRDRLSYLMVFSEDGDKETLIKATNRFANAMVDTSVSVCEKDEIIYILSKLATFDLKDNITAASDDYNTSIFSSDVKFNVYNISIDSKRTVIPIVALEYPSSLYALSFANYFARCSTNTIITLDVTYPNQNSIVNDIKNTLKELSSRANIKMDYSDQLDTGSELAAMEQLYTDISQGSEQIVSATLRMYVYADSEKELKENTENVLSVLNNQGIKTFTATNEMKDEYIRLFTTADTVGNAMPCEQTYSEQFPFYYQSHIDPHGIIHGFTETGGIAAPDFFRKTSSRTSYDMLLLGVKGSGKTVTLLKLMQSHIIRGHKILVLDIEGQMQNYAKVLDGQIIKLSRQSTINPLEIRAALISSIDDASTLYISELSRIVTFMYQYIPDLTDMEAEVFKDVLALTYNRFGITENSNFSEIKAKDYPTFADVLTTLRGILYAPDGSFSAQLTERKIELYEKMEIYLKQLSEGIYSAMFCGESNVHISEKSLVIFDVKALSEMDERIYDAQLFNILSLMWAETSANVQHNNVLSNPNDRRYVINVLDEAHRFLKNKQVCEFIEKLLRRSRKYDSAFWFATQSTHELDKNPYAAVILGLVQYKIILKQSTETKNQLLQMFPQFTPSEITSSTTFHAGETLMSIDTRLKLRCYIEVSDGELMYMGTSRDREQITITALHTMYPQISYDEVMYSITNDYAYFVDEFSKELMNYLGFQIESSPELLTICVMATKQLARAIESGGVKFDS